MEVTRRPDGVTVVNDAYNANPEAVSAALSAVAAMAGSGRAFAVLGYMTELGADAEELHEEAGRQAARVGLAGLIVVGDPAAPILTGAKAEPSWRGELLQVPDAESAVAAVGRLIRPGDVVLVKASRAANLQRVALALTGELPL
jgi:UDP-N-acetylmuramoyl-tripeptide--D-alanyl-D-alanine ligase